MAKKYWKKWEKQLKVRNQSKAFTRANLTWPLRNYPQKERNHLPLPLSLWTQWDLFLHFNCPDYFLIIPLSLGLPSFIKYWKKRLDSSLTCFGWIKTPEFQVSFPTHRHKKPFLLKEVSSLASCNLSNWFFTRFGFAKVHICFSLHCLNN